MKHIYFTFSILLLTILTAKSQSVDFGNVTYNDLILKSTTLDSHANAVVLKEYGTTSINFNDIDGSTFVDHHYKVRIKIFNSDGFDNGNIIIPIYKNGNLEEKIIDLQARTINYGANGMEEDVLDKKKIFTEVRSKYITLTKFTLPNLKEGSVIEYSYHLQSPRIFNFRTWEMQSDIPKIQSDYLVNIPAIYNYNVSLRGALKLEPVKPTLNRECLSIAGNKIDCSKILYSMKNIPAFVEEEYMTAPSNFKSAIYFELSDIQRLNGSKESITKTWKDVDYELTHDKSFGGQMKRKELFKDVLPVVLKNTTDDLSKAKAVYKYIQSNIKWDNYLGMYSVDNIKKVMESHSGSTADINIALIAALSAANLDAEALILSTRSNGTVNDLFPVISDFNYVVAKVNIGTESYLLDASDPLLPFGLLPLRCINERGRVISFKKPSYWYDLKASQKRSTRYNLSAELTDAGIIKGKLITSSLGYAAYDKREKIKSLTSVDEYVEQLDERMAKIKILKHEIQNIDSVESPLIEVYDVEMNYFDESIKNGAFFNPFFIERIEKNPFNMKDRTYPIDMGSLTDTRIHISLKLPANYTVAEKPKDASIGLVNAGGKYLTRTELVGQNLEFNQVLQFDKPVYDSNEYLSLKEFYSKVIQLQKTDIVLKRAE